MVKLSTLSLSSLVLCISTAVFIAPVTGGGNRLQSVSGFTQSQETEKRIVVDGCSDKRFRDSLVEHYIRGIAQQLPGAYNNPRWGDYCDSVLLICPNTAEAYQLKAIPALKSGDYATAFQLNDKAAALEPAAFLDYRAFLKCIFTKDFEGAIADFREAEKLSPTGGLMDHSYSFFLGLCNMELGKYAEAETYLKKDILLQNGGDSLKAPHFNSSFYMGLLYYRMKRLDEAKKYLNECLATYEQHPEANYYMGLIAGAEKNNALATRYLNNARRAIRNGYRMNEDNIYYTNYPGQITVSEINAALDFPPHLFR